MNNVDTLAVYDIPLKQQGGRPPAHTAEAACSPQKYQIQSTVKNILEDINASKALEAEQIQRAETLREVDGELKSVAIEMLENRVSPDKIILKLSNIIMHLSDDKAFYKKVQALVHKNYSDR
ncbi:hypothetical protein LI142_17250 [Eubacterium limosum]|uniref:Uncharacterized protein n=2 Tax=root TaxID=1 RepID=A0ABT5URL3_EUBLI|nr:hypothetical protein [Eubacterium limosum]MCB6571248.1 hypothetical protein [Eubacterium limosum]MDE1471323.1 hypothetical protein [Eubacterium limosum]